MMKYCLGIDQGGTKTDAVIMDYDGNILSKGQSGGACYIYVGMDEAMNRIWEASECALTSAGITVKNIDVIAVCMTGADWEFEYELLRNELKKLFYAKNLNQNTNIILENDCIAALRSGTDALQCGIICMGTGGNIALRNKNGEQFIFGYYLPNEYQGASSLGNKGFNAVIEAFVGLTPPTSLTSRILEFTGENNPEELLTKVTMGKLHIDWKNLSPIVFEEAEKGDEISKKLIVDMAEYFTRCVITAAANLDIDLNDFELVLSGGMFKGKGYQMSDELRKNFKKYPEMKITDGRYEPVVGAGLLGLDFFYNRRLPYSVISKIEHDCKKLDLIRSV